MISVVFPGPKQSKIAAPIKKFSNYAAAVKSGSSGKAAPAAAVPRDSNSESADEEASAGVRSGSEADAELLGGDTGDETLDEEVEVPKVRHGLVTSLLCRR